MPPLVPLIVTVRLPAGVFGCVVTFSVALPEPAMEAGVNVAVAFAGRPVANRLTVPAKTFKAPTVTAKVVLFPCVTLRELGVAEIVKSGDGWLCGFTVSATVAVRTRDPLAPVIVSVELPDGVLAAVVTVSVALPDPLTVEGVNDAVDLLGRPVTPRFTALAKPLAPATVTA